MPYGDVAAYASLIMAILVMDEPAYRAFGDALREAVVSRHSLPSLMRGMMREMSL